MTSLPTNPTTAPTTALLEAVALLESQTETLQTAVYATLRQHLFQNHGRLMTPRPLPATSQEIVQDYLHYLRFADQTYLVGRVSHLAEQGLGHRSALAVTDTLHTTAYRLLQETNGALTEIVPRLDEYRHQFLLQYMHAREQITINAREGFYQNVELALERQVQQERELRQTLLERSDLLARERALLTGLLDSIPDLIFYKDIDGVYLGCNDAFAEFSGRSEAELVGHTDLELYPPEEAIAFREQDLQIMREGQAQRNEKWEQYTDGRRVLLDTLKIPFYSAEKKLLGLIGLSRDITAIHESQRELLKLGYVVEQSLDGTAVANLDGIVQFVNPAWAAMHGYTQDELIGQHLSIFHTPEQLTEEVEPVNQQAIASGQSQRAEIGHMRKDGSTFPTMMTIGLLRDYNGDPVGLVASAQDITERKAADANLRENQARLAEATRIARLHYWELDIATQRFTFLPEYYELLGTTAEEEGGYTMLAADYARKYMPAEEAAIVEKETMAALATTDPDYYREFDSFNVTKDGRVFPIRVRFRVIKDENGQTIKTIGANQDITEQVEAARALQESEERFRNILENANEIIYTLSLAGVFQYVSPAWTELLGHPVAEVEGQPFAPFVHPDDVPVCAAFLQNIIVTGQSQRGVEYRVRHKDGSWRWHSSNGSAVKDEAGNVLYFVGLAQDVTEQKAAEEALAKRVRELQAVSEIGTAVAATLEPDALLQKVVNLTKSRFNLYHAHIYLFDKTGTTLNLTAGAGEIGQKMVAQGWQIPLSQEHSLVAHVARTHRGAIANDVRAESHFLSNPLLPETRAELAVPIIIGDELLGVLDVQADALDHFSEEDVFIQTTLANQIGVAMQNARSYMLSEAARQELSQLTRRLTREGWNEYLKQRQQAEMRVTIGQDPHNGQALAQSLVVQGEQIGRLALTEPQNLTDEAAEIITAVAERLSSHIENLRLTEQAQVALAETAEQAERLALLNQIAQVISQTLDRDQMLDAVYEQIKRVFDLDAFHIGLYDAATETLYYPLLYEADQRQQAITAPLNPNGHSYQVIQTGKALLRHLTKEEADQILAEQHATLPGQEGQITTSLLFAPLRASQQTLGVISAQSYKPNAYTEEDLQLFDGIARYVSVALENADLFARTRQRATTLQTLSEMETALSLAQTEDDILDVLLSHLPQKSLMAATLGYFEQVTDTILSDEVPVSLSSLWISGAFMPDIASQFQSVPLNTFASSSLWRENAYTPTMVGNVLTMENAPPRLREDAEAQGWRGIVLMPLRSGGRWQGLISINWADPQDFTEDDVFLLNRLMEPVAAVVAGRRAQLAQKEALYETELLYNAGAALNAAQSYEEILTVIRQHTIADRAQSASLSLFDRPWTDEQMPEWVEVAAYHTSRTDANVPPRFFLKQFPSASSLLKADSPTLIEDVEDPSLEIDAFTRALYAQQFGAKAVIFVPLVVGGQWIGYINVLYRDVRSFSETAIRRLMALATQAAVAIQNVGSVAETRERAEELGVLNEMSRALASMLDPGEIIESIYHFTSQLLDATNFYIALYDEQTNEISFPYAVEGGERVNWLSRPFGEGLTEYLLRSQRPLLVEDNLQEWLDTQTGVTSIGNEANSWLGAPMISGKQAIGVIAVQSTNDHQFNTNHMNLLSAIGSQTTIALQNARLFQQTQARAQREQILREITARVRSSADVETIMKTAVQEIGHTLGRKAMIYLGDEHGA